MEEILHILAVSVGSIVALFVLTKLMGYRQMSQLSMFDYVNGITIGSIAAEMATSLENDFVKPLTAMVIYTLAELLFSRISELSIFCRRIVVGRPKVLYDNGKLYYNNLKQTRLDLGEFLSQCRVAGYFDLSQLQTIVMEPNGHLSFLPKADNRPLTPTDLTLKPKEETVPATVIIDGHVMKENLRTTGYDEKWLLNKLKGLGITNTDHVFLATCDGSGSLNAYVKIKDKPTDSLI